MYFIQQKHNMRKQTRPPTTQNITQDPTIFKIKTSHVRNVQRSLVQSAQKRSEGEYFLRILLRATDYRKHFWRNSHDAESR